MEREMELDTLPLVQHETKTLHGGQQLVLMFENGYGASVVRHQYSYGGPQGLWELAVLDCDSELTYDTPITNDVIGNMTEEEVRETLLRISRL
jgi:hypothetical protein